MLNNDVLIDDIICVSFRKMKSFFDGRRREILLIILIIQLSGYVIKSDASFIVDSALHFSHRFLRLFLRLIFNK